MNRASCPAPLPGNHSPSPRSRPVRRADRERPRGPALRRRSGLWLLPLLLLLVAPPLPTAQAATLHVWPESPDSEPPFATWESAARGLQEALDAARPGDLVLVTNGVYATGGRLVEGGVLNRIVVPPGVTVQSVGGPAVTILEGAPRVATPDDPAPGTAGRNDHGNGDGAVRCAWLGRDAVLSGFTLRNGHTRTNGTYDLDQSGGGAWTDSNGRLVECVLTNNAAHHFGGGSYRAELVRCQVVDNTARYGGGACLATGADTVLRGNSAENGGGAYMGRLTRCTLAGNDSNMGGGMMGGSMLECWVTGNVAGQWGGGLYQVAAQRCRIEGNQAERGGGAFISTVFASLLTGNTGDLGGGAAGGTLRHCTVTGNTGGSGGGVYLVAVQHSIVYFNDAVLGPNHEGSTFVNSCTTPLPETGPGNRADDPRLASTSHVSSESPARETDAAAPELDIDLDGDPWQQPSHMGCDQLVEGQAGGELVPVIAGGALTVAAGHPLAWRAEIRGRTTGSAWDFGDGVIVRNQPFVRHAWDQPGTYRITLTATNDSHPEGVAAALEIRVVERPVLFVAATGSRPTPPFATWATAADTIQAAVDAATVPGSLVLVTNGLYNRGGGYLDGDGLLNRVALTRPVTVRSVNGPAATLITGIGPVSDFAVRCAFVGRDAVLSGFTLTNGFTRTLGSRPREQRGGGVSGEALGLVTNCVLTGNYGREFGGGANRATLHSCRIIRNNSFDGAGGVYESVVENSLLDGNRASNTGGGASRSLLSRCRLVGNSAPLGAGAYFGTLDFCRIDGNTTEGSGYGGGANGSLLRDCVVSNNVAYSGGGAHAATLVRCHLEGNVAGRDGGGTTDSTLSACTLVGNSANYGGGASASLLADCTLSRNRASVAGGGVNGGELDRCTLTGNRAFFGGASEDATLRHCLVRTNSADVGGGSHADRLVNCLLQGNTAEHEGGGAYRSQLLHCTVLGNRADAGGGTFAGTNRNSIVYYNEAFAGPDFQDSVLIATCTSPSPFLPPGNPTNPPAFLRPELGDYRLRADSPAIDTALAVEDAPFDDLDGALRPVDGDLDGLAVPDLGAFEYDPEITDSNLDGIPDAWYLRYGLDPVDPGAAEDDPDHDLLDNHGEWIAGTHPADPASGLAVTVSNLPPVTILVPSIPGRLYSLLARDQLAPPSAESPDWIAVPGQEAVPGDGQTLALSDTNAVAPRYYRVEVRLAATGAVPVPTARPTGNASRPAGTPTRITFPARIDDPWSDTEDGDSSFPGSGPRLADARGAAWRALAAAETKTETPTLAAWSASSRNLASAVAGARPPALPDADPRSLEQTSRVSLHAGDTSAPPHRVWIPAGEGIPISPMLRGQEPFMLYAQSARRPTLELGRGAVYRGVAGGTDAETYVWKDLSANSRPHQWSYHVDDPPVVTTLEWLEQARDHGAELIFTVNTRGHGIWGAAPPGRRTWYIDTASNGSDYVANLAADWVRYANLIAPRYRLEPDGQLPPNLAATDPEAHRILEELRFLGNGTNSWRYRLATTANPDLEVDPWLERPLLPAADAPAPRKVRYWEIGNEVETSMALSNSFSPRLVDSTIDLSPAQYVERYLRITDAMLRVDPDILVGPCPNNPWGPHAGVENQHLIRLLATPEAVVDLIYYHYYMIWYGSYNDPSDVSRNLRLLKNYGHLLHTQYAAHFARAGRPMPPAIISEWNPDSSIHPPVERSFLSALATAEAFFTFVELQALAAVYWENPDGRASRFVFDHLASHLGDRFLGGSCGDRTDDGSYAGFGQHPSTTTDVRVYVTRRSSDDRVFVWMLNLSPTTPYTIAWQHPRPLVEARTHVLRNPQGPTTFYTPESQLAWVETPAPTDLPESVLPPGSLAILELTYAPAEANAPAIAAPIIASLDTTRGPAGSELVVEGKGFAATPTENVVHFGNGRATVLEASPTRLRLRVPATATYGPLTVTAGGRTGWSHEYFTLAATPGRDEPLRPDSLVPLPRRIHPPEGAPIVTAPIDLQLADWRADGRLHLAGLTSRTGSVLPDSIDLFPNTSLPDHPSFDTPFCDPQMPLCTLPLNSSPARILFSDLDSDGQLDLAGVDRHAWHVAAWRNARPVPERSFDVMGLYPTGSSPSDLAIHDLDGDGRPDLLVTHALHGTLGVLHNSTPAPGAFLFDNLRLFAPADPEAMIAPHTLAVGDLVGDARPDVVVVSRASSSLTIFENTGTPGHPNLRPLPSPIRERAEALQLGDIDGDGRLDILVTGPYPAGGIIIWRNAGTNGFERSAVSTTRDPRQFCLADLTGDGRPDLVTANNDTGSVSVLRNRSEPGQVAFDDRRDFAIPGLQPNDPICLVAGDVDGDGWTDVAVGHYYSGFVTLLHNRPPP